MPWRFIGTIAALVIIMIFVAFNIHNSCDLSVVFTTIPDVPVYLTVFFSYVLGLISFLPFFVIWILKRKSKKELTSEPANKTADTKGKHTKTRKITQETPAADTSYGID
jgi:glucan phosphoethanolaminetransferase (alkaline phosphatase superfamily)